MGKVLSLKIISQDKQMLIRVRQKLTISNLKSIVANKLKIGRQDMRIKLADTEMAGHKRLIDLKLADGDILEVKTINFNEQTAIEKDNPEEEDYGEEVSLKEKGKKSRASGKD